MTKSTFILRRGDRLAARLRHILHAWRFTRQVNGRLLVSWPPRDRSPYGTLESELYNLSLILDLPLFYQRGHADEIVFFEGPFDDHKRFPQFSSLDVASDAPDNFDRERLLAVQGLVCVSNQYFYKFADESRSEVREQVRTLFKSLPLSGDLQALLRSAKDQIGTERYAALHVRRGDIVAVLRAARDHFSEGRVTDAAKNYAVHAAKQTAPMAYYLDHVAGAVKDGLPVVFFSDTPGLFNDFARVFPKGSILDGRTLGANTKYALQKAFVDFSLLGSATKLIGTQTGFASFASALGGSEHVNVTARGDWDMFLKFMYDDILEGHAVPAPVRSILEAAAFAEYDRYHQAAVKRGLNL